MKISIRLVPAVAATALAAAGVLAGLGAPAASAAPAPGSALSAAPAYGAATSGSTVFVQTDNPAGNRVVVYRQGADGGLSAAGSYATGGVGGVLAGSVVDHLASQGSLTYDPAHGLLYAVNAGSNTVSVFSVRGDRLALRQVVGSGGTFLLSVAVHGDSVYVLNATDGGSLQGYAVVFGRLVALPGSGRSLGLDPTATPQFTNTPGQVAFSPDGSQLIVTTKANGNDIDVFTLRPFGYLSPIPVVNAEPGTVPFGVSFDRRGDLVVAEAGTNALATFRLGRQGIVAPLSAVATGQSATCWVTPAGGFFFASNAGSGTLSGYAVSPAAQLTLLGSTATDQGTVDAAASSNGRFLYVQTGAEGIVDGYRVGAGGSLVSVGSVTVPGAVGGEGIAVS